MNARVPESTPRLKIAIQKSGRLADRSQELLERCGLRFSRSRDRLFCFGQNMPVDLLLVRDDDIPGLLRNGTCDLGIVGDNVAEEQRLGLLEEGVEPGYSTLKSLDFGSCRLSIAIPEGDDYPDVSALSGRRIATSYPALTARFLKENGIEAGIIKLSGSVEIAPSLGAAEAISDLVSTGSTLRANHLREVEVMFRSTAALLRRGDKLAPEKEATVSRLLRRVEGVLQVKESKYVMLHAPKSALADIKTLLPGAESPTILPLDGDSDRVAVHAVCRETVFWEHLEELETAGASAILVLPVEKMLA
jgi:ATP phosphoribosyltransferase